MADKEWKEASAENAESWDRKKQIEGKYIKKQSNVGPNESMVYTLKTKDGEIGVWGSTVLDTKFSYIPINSEVRIDPPTTVKSDKTGREYQDYKVMFKEPEFEEVQEHPKDDLSDMFPGSEPA